MTIVCRYIFLRFCPETGFASTKFCDLYAEMVQGQKILMFYTTIVHIANVCGHKILRFWANPAQKYQTLVPTKISHLKVSYFKTVKTMTFQFSLYNINQVFPVAAIYVNIFYPVSLIPCAHAQRVK